MEPNTLIAVPAKLLQAIQDKAVYFELIGEFKKKYDLKTDAEAWQELEAQLEKYGLPYQFVSAKAFYKARWTFVKSKTR